MKRKYFIIFATFMVFSSIFSANTNASDSQSNLLTSEEREMLLNSSQDAMVCLTVKEEGSEKEVFAGTGFFIHEDGILLTNYHVIFNAKNIFAYSYGGRDKVPFHKIIYCDRMRDFCILQFGVKVPHPVTVRTDSLPQGGEKVYTLGFVENCDNLLISSGNFHERKQLFKRDFLTATTVTVLGNSGGPLLDDDGHTFGVVAGILPKPEPPKTYAIPIMDILDVDLGGQEVPLGELTIERPMQSFYKGINYFNQSNYSEAVDSLTDSLPAGPEYFVYYLRGISNYNLGRMNESLSDMNNANNFASNDQERSAILSSRGLIYKERNEFNKALDDFTQAIDLYPRNAAAFHNRGLFFDLKGNHAKAVSDYSEAISVDPQLVNAYYDRGLSYHNQGDLDKAIKDYTKALELNSNYGNAYWNRAVAYYQQSNFTKSRADAIRAKELGVNVDSGILQELGLQ